MGQSAFQQVRCALQVFWGESWPQDRRFEPSGTPNEDTARSLHEWLIGHAERLRDPILPVLQRRRIAWSILPDACIGRADDERVANEVADAMERDAERLALASTAHRGDIDGLREKYAPNQGPRDLWLYLTESVRFTAEHFREIIERVSLLLSGKQNLRSGNRGTKSLNVESSNPTSGTNSRGFPAALPERNCTLVETWARPESVAQSAAGTKTALAVQAAFLLIVFDALCPGYGQYVDEESACAALQAWTLKQRWKGPGRWATIERLLRTRRPHVSEDTMMREWKLKQGKVRLKAKDVLLGISAHIDARIHALTFDSISVRLLTIAILEADLMRSHARHPVRTPPYETTRSRPP